MGLGGTLSASTLAGALLQGGRMARRKSGSAEIGN